MSKNFSGAEHSGLANSGLRDAAREMEFLKSTLRKCRIECDIIEPSLLLRYMERDVRAFFSIVDTAIPTELVDSTLYKYSDSLERNFALMKVEISGESRILIIGPYMTRVIDEGYRETALSGLGLDSERSCEAVEYLQTLAFVPDGSAVIPMIQSFAEIAFGTPSYATVYYHGELARVEPPMPPVLKNGADITVKMRAMERRYEFENEIMRSVTNGRRDTEEMLRSSFTPDMFEQRVLDPLRNSKNYCIIMNTLLRKAAEAGGVHPIYIDEMSSYNAERIEALSSHVNTGALMSDMFRGYCRLVRRHAHKEYSPVVRRAVIMIDADLSADLSAGVLAAALDVSLGYLSTVFKKEVGVTVSEYVRNKRMEYAEHLLKTTDQQVQSVAISVGIVDLNYFTRLFKARTGKTPTEYRRGASK